HDFNRFEVCGLNVSGPRNHEKGLGGQKMASETSMRPALAWSPVQTTVRTRLVRLVLEHALEGPPCLLASLRCLALSLHRRLLVVLAPLHLLKEAVLEHLLLELLQGSLDLIIEDNDLHSGHPEMSRRTMA